MSMRNYVRDDEKIPNYDQEQELPKLKWRHVIGMVIFLVVVFGLLKAFGTFLQGG